MYMFISHSTSKLWWEIEENKHSNNGARLQLVHGRINTMSAHSLCVSPAYTQQGLHPCVLKELINLPGHREWVSPDSTKKENKNHA